MTAGEDATQPADPRAGLAAQLQQLENYVSKAAADGDDLPPEALEMIARLREILRALDALTSSIAGDALPDEPAGSDRA